MFKKVNSATDVKNEDDWHERVSLIEQPHASSVNALPDFKGQFSYGYYVPVTNKPDTFDTA